MNRPHLRRTVLLASLLGLLAATIPAPAPGQDDATWDIMTLNEMGVDRFLETYPDLDGRGVVIAVMDTGVDMGVEGLKVCPDGEVKVVDARDFTGEGDLHWTECYIVPNGEDGDKLVDGEGRELRGFRKATEGLDVDRFYMAFLDEADLDGSSVQDLNGDGDKSDRFGFLIFYNEAPTEKEAAAVEEEVETVGTVENESGESAGEGDEPAAEEPDTDEPAETPEESTDADDTPETIAPRFEAIVDLNGDGNLDDGVRLTDYWRAHETFVLKGKKGGRDQLTMALNFFPDEQRLSVHFDDGGHGTHVAGIAAGYRVHGQDGYHGMAPGARVMSLKIGNNRYAGGSTVTESVKKALDFGVEYAKEHKVPVVFNMSFGIGSEREGESAIDRYVDDLLWKNPGVVFVTSAGNEGPGLSSVGTPAASVRAIAVGALLGREAAAAQYGCTLDNEVAFSFSSRGGDTFKPDVMAPGSASSTVPPWGDNDHMNGTSMASPAAAGAVALLVDGLVRHDPPYEIDNALVLRAVKNTGRHLEGMTPLDEGGGVLDLPAAFDYALFLYGDGESDMLREYRISNRGPAAGKGIAYWRTNPAVPRKTETMNFSIQPGFAEGITDEDKARFYRAFDLTPDVDWLSLTRPMDYLKGGGSASVGLMVDLEGRAPGLYTGKVTATRKSMDRLNDAPIPEFDLVVAVIVPHRVTPDNRGVLQAQGEILPGYVDRVFVEVPPGTTALAFDLRMIDGGQASTLSAGVFDPEGVQRGRVGRVSERDNTESHGFVGNVVPGTWEVVVNSSIRSRAPARYDLKTTLSGMDFTEPVLFARTDDTTRRELLVQLKSSQARSFSGTVSARIDGLLRREVIEVADAGEYTRTFHLDNTFANATWQLDFDRETYALFTDCVLRVEEVETGKALVNTGLGQRSTSISITVPKGQADPKEYKFVLLPAFTQEKDFKQWRFTLSEKLTFASAPAQMDLVEPKNNRVRIQPWDWVNLHYRLPGNLPTPPAGYALNLVFEATGGEPAERIVRETFGL